MAHQASSFEALPLELHVNVLSHMSTPEDVRATIRASPAALAALMTGRERIYAVVLETGIAPEVFRELLALVNAPDHSKCPDVAAPQPEEEFEEVYDSVIGEWVAWGQNLHGFLKSHARGAVYPIPDPKMNATKFNAQIKFMIQLYFCLSKFVNFYPTFVRSTAAHIPPPTNRFGQQVQEGQDWPQLNEQELLRLQRGLLRYELYCRLVGLPSIAASCNSDVYEAIVEKDGRRIWCGNPFCVLLPTDEVEEIICASLYVRNLYLSLRWDLAENSYNHILDLNESREEGTLWKLGRLAKEKTVGHWLSKTDGQILDFGCLDRYCILDWTESMNRLGLGFLDRVIRSTLAERRQLMQSALNRLLTRHEHLFLWRDWEDVVFLARTSVYGPFFVGPHCNPLIRTSSGSHLLADTIVSSGAQHRLRNLGWVFFDDKFKLRSLGLPHDAKASSVRDWVERTPKQRDNPLSHKPKIPDSVLAARFTKDEWKELIIEKYPTKDCRGNYQALSRFVAGARAVVDFTSSKLPQVD